MRKHRAALMGVLSPAIPSSMSNSSDGGKEEGQTKSGGYKLQLDDLICLVFRAGRVFWDRKVSSFDRPP